MLCEQLFLIHLQQGRTALIAASDSGFADIVKLIVDKISEFSDDERQKYLDHKKHVSIPNNTTFVLYPQINFSYL